MGCLSVGWFGCLLVYCATFVALRILLAVFCLFGVIRWVALVVELVCWFGWLVLGWCCSSVVDLLGFSLLGSLLCLVLWVCCVC